MSPLALASFWICAGVLGATLVRRRRLVWLVFALPALAAFRTTVASDWPGPAGSSSGGLDLVLGRPGAGMLAVAALGVTATFILAPALDRGGVLLAGLVGAVCTVLMSATMPLVWGLAAAVATGALAVRWIAVAPGRATLAAGRIGGVGISCLLGAAGFEPPAGAAFEPRAVLSGSLLAVGVGCLVALVPFGGWGAGVVAVLGGADIAPWALLLAPALIVSSMTVGPHLMTGGRIPFDNSLLVLGLATAIVSGLAAGRVAAHGRYGRLWMADLGLAAAGVGTTHAPGRTGALLIIGTHLCVGPLLLTACREGIRPQCRLAWLAISGAPPAPVFWGRYLVLVGCTATAPSAMVAALFAVTVLFFVAIESVVHARGDQDRASAIAVATTFQRATAWAVASVAVAAGFAPGVFARVVFGL